MTKNEFLIELSESDRTDFGRVEFDEQTEAQRVFSAIWALESQVNNGGFWQYFHSTDGGTANFVPTALRHVGANQCAGIVARALATVSPEGLPGDQTLREQVMEMLSVKTKDVLESLDQEFFAYPDNLTDLLFEYVRRHPETFGPVGHE